MEKEKMLVTRALNELKLLDARITREIAEADFVAAAKTKDEKVHPHMTKKEYCDKAKARFQSIQDLIDRRAKIKAAIVESNAVTMVDIHGMKMTVAAAIDMKMSIEYWIDLNREIKRQHTDAVALANKKNLDMEKSIDKYLESMFGSEAKSNKDKYIDNVTPIREANEYSLVDPINAEEESKKLTDMISGFQSEVDSVLQISNCTTWIEF